MSRLNKTDLELLQTGQSVDLSAEENAYLGGEFTENPNDYVEVLIYDAKENFLESAVVDSQDYIVDGGIKLKTGTILRKLGYEKGRYIVKYNFLRKVAGSYENILVGANNQRYTGEFDPNNKTDIDRIGNDLFIKEYKYFIHEISPSKHEVRLAVDTIKEPEHNHRYLRDFYNMQKTTKRVASLGDEDLSLMFIKPDNNEIGKSFELQFGNSSNTFTQQMLGGTINLNQAFVTKIIPPDTPKEQGPGSNPLSEMQSETLTARFGITNTDVAKITDDPGDPSLWELWNIFKGKKLDATVKDIKLSFDTEGGDAVENVLNMEKSYEFDKGTDGPQVVEISSISSRPLTSSTTYVWTVFGFDTDNRWQNSTWRYPKGRRIYSTAKAVVQSGDNDGDFKLISGGVGGIAEATATWTDKNVKEEGSKIAIEMHSNDLHLGVHLLITNDIGQTDEIVIPAFLNTQQ